MACEVELASIRNKLNEQDFIIQQLKSMNEELLKDNKKLTNTNKWLQEVIEKLQEKA